MGQHRLLGEKTAQNEKRAFSVPKFNDHLLFWRIFVIVLSIELVLYLDSKGEIFYINFGTLPTVCIGSVGLNIL